MGTGTSKAAERDILALIHRRISSGSGRFFRNNVGTGWQGSKVVQQGGAVTLMGARPLHAGLCVGSSDLIGWVSVEITPDMVGRKVAVFSAIEAKAAGGRVSEDQQRFIDAVKAAGGLAGVARSEDEAAAVLRGLV